MIPPVGFFVGSPGRIFIRVHPCSSVFDVRRSGFHANGIPIEMGVIV
jgi:hypothetical protein